MIIVGTVYHLNHVLGYSIFVVVGHLPDCEADQLLQVMPAVQPIKPRLLTELNRERSSTSSKTEDQAIDHDDLLRALEESSKLANSDDPSLNKVLRLSGMENDEATLQRALALSMTGKGSDVYVPVFIFEWLIIFLPKTSHEIEMEMLPAVHSPW